MNDKDTHYHKYRTAANGITLLRIAGTIGLCFPALMSPLFFVLYGLTGVTDALDGWIARKTGTASPFGAKLDSIADLLFYAVMLLRLFPVLWQTLPRQIWFGVGVVLLLRLSAYLAAAIKYHSFASLHTYLNKVTGAAVFLLPFVLAVSSGVAYCWGVCILGGLSSLEELAIHLFRDSAHADIKYYFQHK